MCECWNMSWRWWEPWELLKKTSKARKIFLRFIYEMIYIQSDLWKWSVGQIFEVHAFFCFFYIVYIFLSVFLCWRTQVIPAGSYSITKYYLKISKRMLRSMCPWEAVFFFFREKEKCSWMPFVAFFFDFFTEKKLFSRPLFCQILTFFTAFLFFFIFFIYLFIYFLYIFF